MPPTTVLSYASHAILLIIFAAFVASFFLYPTKEQRRWYTARQLNPWRLALRQLDGIEPQDRQRLVRYGLTHFVILAGTGACLLIQFVRVALLISKHQPL